MNGRFFTGVTLRIGGTGRTDLQNGDAGAQYDSLFDKLLTPPEDTLVYPAHDQAGRRRLAGTLASYAGLEVSCGAAPGQSRRVFSVHV